MKKYNDPQSILQGTCHEQIILVNYNNSTAVQFIEAH